MTNSTRSTQIHLRAAGVSLVLDTPSTALPSILHWGADLGETSAEDLGHLAATVSPLLENAVDVPVRVSMVPEHSAGWLGAPGLQGHRNGADWSTRFDDVRYTQDASTVTAVATDAVAQLELVLDIELTASGVLRSRATLTNRADSAFEVQRLVVTFPVPPVATESLDQAGRWAKERVPQRRDITVGTHLRESRRGRTGADAATVLIAGEAGFGFGPASGEVWGLHVGFSGNHVSYLERMTSGKTLLGGGELLLPGEVVLGRDESYATPWIYGSWGRGLDEQAARFHEWLRARPSHPGSVRPVTLNVWEAVYFDHRIQPLLELAEHAAAAGVERYVLDDGWFSGRRSDDAGLGDWVVDAEVWPKGLHPLVSRVRELGMQFGLWFEPEMVNPDSDLARAHPEWILQTGGRMPLEQRKQQVLNLAIDEAYAYILESISSLVTEYRLDYLKWDHNRDLVDAGSTVTGTAGVSAQTHAVYRLFAELKARHPLLEIESCSSGGARVDLGVLEFTDRVWASDCIDPLERQGILRWTGQLLPPELVGSHIGSPHSHTTGRRHDLSFRASTALFGHFGVEWNISKASEEERAELAEWIELHKRFRPLIHSGRTVRVDHPVTELAVHGIVAQDRSEALFEFALLARPSTWPPGLVRIPGLEPDARYRVTSVGPRAPFSTNNTAPSWQAEGGVVLSGRALAAVGIQAPPLQPEHSALVYVEAL
ncbi:alpha-galactosidase [Mycetocola zhadangensis]|uniref:alpha-galactosidase n=1 Tax=Mycetocola zhadangensis TaxID=1164595 RepID=UPI003A4E1154